MKTFWLQIAGLLILIFGAFYLTINRNSFIPQSNPFINNNSNSGAVLKIVDVSSGNLKASVNIEISDTKEKRSKGLGDRENLEAESGMLFVFVKKDVYRFWMKGMKFPLDFVWIEGDKIVDLLAGVLPPETGQTDDTLPLLAPIAPIDKVLEVNANYIRDHNIAIGDKISY